MSFLFFCLNMRGRGGVHSTPKKKKNSKKNYLFFFFLSCIVYIWRLAAPLTKKLSLSSFFHGLACLVTFLFSPMGGFCLSLMDAGSGFIFPAESNWVSFPSWFDLFERTPYDSPSSSRRELARTPSTDLSLYLFSFHTIITMTAIVIRVPNDTDQCARRSRPKGRVPPILPPDTHGPLCDPTTAPASNFDPGDAPSAPLSPSTKPFLLAMAWVFIEPALSRANFSKTGVRRLAQSLLPSPVVVFGVGKGPRDADWPSQRHFEVLSGMVVLEPPRLAHRCGFLSVVHFPLSRPLRSLRPTVRSETLTKCLLVLFSRFLVVFFWVYPGHGTSYDAWPRAGSTPEYLWNKALSRRFSTFRRQVTWEQDWSCLSAFSCLRVPSVCDSERVCVSVELSSASHFMGPSKRAGVGMVSLWIASIPQRPIRRLPTTILFPQNSVGAPPL
ncbi:unnamed protein product [Acanthosepion pharaonis]|uniref:Uncharacterized protein n=1 Tax=Acanthosepion pharaonis TaxID=158019 RepID=A0A812DPP2_ACAPH|nr:unnamed protein product [Sepia pharaonis]